MKGWFTVRLLVLTTASLLAFYALNYGIVNVGFPPTYIHPVSWVLISGVWLVGLVTVKYQFDRLPPDQQKPQQPASHWLDRLRQKEESGKRADRTLGQIAQTSQLPMNQVETENYPGIMPSTATREVQTHNGAEIGKVVEGVLEDSLADAEMSMELEVPAGTKLTVFGQQLDVTKGKIKIRPRKRTQKKIEDLFGTKGRRKPA